MKTICCILAFTVASWACTTGASGNCEVGSGKTYSTISSCLSAMSAGQTCQVFGNGVSYNETATVPAGSTGNYNSLIANPGDTVFILGVTLNSHAKVKGFHIQNTSSPTSACVSIPSSTTDFYITNNVMYACGGVNESSASHGFIQGNTLSYIDCTSTAPNTGPAMAIHGDHHLIENNDISHVSDGFHFSGSFNVIRKNTMHDTLASECGSHSGNCHIDFFEDEPSAASQYNVLEENTILNNLGANGHGYLTQADVCGGQCFNVIIRFNTAAHLGTAGIIDDNAFSSNPGYSYVKSYNNDWVDVGTGATFDCTNTVTHNSTHGANMNDIFYWPGAQSDFNAYCTDSSTVGTYSSGHNLAYCTSTTCNIHGKNYGSGSFTDDPGNIFGQDPKFVNYAANNFALAAGSPAIGTGTNLTTVAAGDSGSGTSLVVTDASYFQDGSGISGVSGDCIAVKAATNHVCVMTVNYTTNTLTLASAITRAAGDPVYIYGISNGQVVLTGTNPDMGAFPSNAVAPPTGGAPAPPTDLSAIVE